MGSLSNFLLARIAEDERDAAAHAYEGPANKQRFARRVLVECETKRRIVEQGWWFCDVPGCSGSVDAREAVLRLLALPHADHPDYDEAWRP